MKKTTKNIISILLVFYCSSFLASKAQTYVYGPTVSGHWTLSGSPYLIQASVYIPQDSTLIIDPGVTVNFQTAFSPSLQVMGTLLAIGNITDSIHFTATDTTAGFNGIRFLDAALNHVADSSKLLYCTINYGKAQGYLYLTQNGGALLFDRWSLALVSHCSITHCIASYSGGAICCDSSSSPVISYNNISGNESSFGNGAGCWFSNYTGALSLTINNNTISYNKNVGASGGGGIYCFNGIGGTIFLTIADNTISRNYNGGGIYCENNGAGTLDISNNIINSNSVNGSGGGINCSSSNGDSVFIHNNIIQYNDVNYNSGGGGIRCGGGNYFIYNNNISYNSSGNNYGGAGMLCEGGNFSIHNNKITNNAAGYWGGGGIFCYTGTYSINYNNISYNTGDNNGGGILCNSSSVTSMSYDTIANNSINYCGGGIYTELSSIDTISNTVIINNIVKANAFPNQGGGGFFCDSASPVIQNVTFANNYSWLGGAIFCYHTAQPKLYNCILWGDTAIEPAGGNEVYQYDAPSAPGFYFCDVMNGESGFGLNSNPYIGNYSNNIDSPTMFVSPSAGDGNSFDGVSANWQLQTGSPCIDAGDSLLSSYPSADLAGNHRVVVCVIDMGAYEKQYTSPFYISITGQPFLYTSTDTLTVHSTFGSNYTWNTGGTSDTIMVSPKTTTVYTVSVDSGGCTALATFTVTVVTTGTNSAAKKSGISVSPNPSKGVYNFVVSGQWPAGSKIDIYNVLGQEAGTSPLIGGSVVVDISNEPNGVYFYKVTDESGGLEGEGKIVIQK
jgi:fibronectin-binding autotransporter adhesin